MAMNKNKYIAEIIAITSELEVKGDIWELYYQRGYLYFLLNEDKDAEKDYRKAVDLGLDYIKYPYYFFSNSNEKRRDFLLPEKIMIALVLVIVALTLFSQLISWYLKIKTML